MNYTCSYASPIGEITLAANDDTLTGLWFAGQKYFANIIENGKAPKACKADRADKASDNLKELKDRGGGKILPILQLTIDWLDIYFSGQEPDFMPTISMNGTPFQMEVWNILREIPYGQTITYGEIAARLARERGISRMSAQAVGGAVSRNPISIIVPCHRVVGADGSLTGYAGGIEKKRELLKLEKKSILSTSTVTK